MIQGEAWKSLLGAAMLRIGMAPEVLVSGAASASLSEVVNLCCREWQGELMLSHSLDEAACSLF